MTLYKIVDACEKALNGTVGMYESSIFTKNGLGCISLQGKFNQGMVYKNLNKLYNILSHNSATCDPERPFLHYSFDLLSGNGECIGGSPEVTDPVYNLGCPIGSTPIVSIFHDDDNFVIVRDLPNEILGHGFHIESMECVF